MDKLLLKNQLCFPLYVASKEIIRKYKEYLDPLDLTYTQYIVMMVLWEEESINVKHLGEKLYLDSGTLTPLLKKLESHKYIDLDVSYLTQGEHSISLSYSGSFTFNEYYTLNPTIITIAPKDTILNIENVHTTANASIVINGTINTNGIIKLYICNDNDCRLIGLVNGDNDTFSYTYKLPPTIDAGEYEIKAQFDGNGYYQKATAFSDLTIEKESKTITRRSIR